MSLNEKYLPKWMVEGGEYVDGYTVGGQKRNTFNPNGFSVSPGMKPNTKGILFWVNRSSFVGRMEERCAC